MMYEVKTRARLTGKVGQGGRRYSAVRHYNGERASSGTEGKAGIMAPRGFRSLCSIYAILLS